MLTQPARLWLCTAPTDMRKQFDGLVALARNHLGGDPLSGHGFVFVNRRRTQLRLLYFDTDGFCIWSKRLEQGQFGIRHSRAVESVALSRTEFDALVEGLDLEIRRRRKRWRKPYFATAGSDIIRACICRGFLALTFDELAARHQQLKAENGGLREELKAKDARLGEIEQQLAWLKDQLFGRKSERRQMVDPALQSSLFASLGVTVPSPPSEPEATPASKRRRKKSRQGTVTDEGLRFGPDVPVEVIEVPAPELAGLDAADYEIISNKSTFRLAQRPGSHVVLEYRAPVVKHVPTGKLKTTPVSANVLERSVADVSFLAGLAIDKCLYHLPLHRQHQRLAAEGLQLSRSTLTMLLARAADLLAPIARAQLEHVCGSQVLAMDETYMKAGRKAPGKMHQGYFWPLYGDADEVSFTFANTRGRTVIQDLLADYEGILLTDGYKVYEQHAKAHVGITHAQCWAHTRRKFDVAKDAEPEASAAALAAIGALYEQEEWIRKRKLEGPDKRTARQTYCAPVVEAFWIWCDQQCQRLDLTPSNPLSKALKYAMARREALEVFLREPDVAVDTNHLERALRPIPMGRKNHLFCWTEVGAEHLAVLHSLLVTCRLQGVDAYTYLVDVLQRVGQHPAREVADLTPRRWKERFADQPLRSDLDRAVPKTRA